MMIAMPALAPFDMDIEDWDQLLSPEGMVGQADEIFEGGVVGWKHNPSVLGTGLQAFVRDLKELTDQTPKIPGAVFLERLRAVGVDAQGIQIKPDAIRREALIEDGDADE